MLSSLHVILAKIETTYGVDPVPTPGENAILVSNLSISPVIEKNERNPLSASFSPFLPGKPRIGIVEVKFSAELKGSGAGTTPPEVAPLLCASALSETIGAGDVTYQPATINLLSITIYAYLDGEVHKITGCLGTLELLLEAGKPGSFNFTFQGLSQLPIDETIPSGAVYNNTTAPVVKGITFYIGGYSPVASKFHLALNNNLTKRDSFNGAGGYAGIAITGRKTAGSFDPEAVTRATHDFWQKMANASPSALTATIGTVAGNRIVLTAPNVIYDSLAWGDRNGMRIYDIPLLFARNSGDDEVVIKFN